MKNISPALTALLAGTNEIYMADLVSITPPQGSPLLITSWATTLVNASSAYPGDDGLTYIGGGLTFVRDKIKWKVGVQVDELSLTFYGNSTTLIAGNPFFQAAVGSPLDGAQVKVLRAFMTAAANSDGQLVYTVVGSMIQFVGIISTIDTGRTQSIVKVASSLQLLNIQMPKNVWQPSCINVLYQQPCNLSRTEFAEIGTLAVTSGGTALVINSGSAKATGYYNLGYLTFTSGANNGISRTIKNFVGGTFTMMNPFPNAPATSDTFNAYVGCDKQLTTCQGYGNDVNFRGMPFVPPVSVIT